MSLPKPVKMFSSSGLLTLITPGSMLQKIQIFSFPHLRNIYSDRPYLEYTIS